MPITTSKAPKQLSDQNSQGTQLGASATDLISFYGATPVAQTTPAGYATFQTAGSTTGLFVNSATTGGTGTTQYTLGDLVAALKSTGLIKA